MKENWSEVTASTNSASDAAVALNGTLQKLYNAAFPVKTRLIKSTDAPWMNDRLKRLIRNKRRYYALHGRNVVWRRKQARLQRLIKAAKKAYFAKIKKKLTEAGDARGYYQGAKLLSSHDAPSRWKIQRMFPGKSDAQIGEVTACLLYTSDAADE